MKRINSNYHVLYVLKSAQPKCVVIISNFDKELVNCRSECFLNILNSNIVLAGCNAPTSQTRRMALSILGQKNDSFNAGVLATSTTCRSAYAR